MFTGDKEADGVDTYTLKFNRKMKKDGRDFVVNLKAGQMITGKLSKRKQIPPQPKGSIEAAKRIQRADEVGVKRK